MQNAPKNAEKYVCKVCDFNCCKLSNWNIHISTTKHTNRTNSNELEQQKCDNKSYKCKYCDKEYKARNSLWYHENKCNVVKHETVSVEKSPDNQQLLNYLIKQNSDLQKQILDICKNGIINNSNNNINSNNKTFNLQVFLHEDCKDAMNMSEFLESIKVQLADVMNIGEVGYIKGISNLIIHNLKSLETTKRPMHCTDAKREVIYIKEEGVWVKDADYSKLRRLVKTVSNRGFKGTRLYKDKYPDCVKPESKYSDVYNKMIVESTGGGSKCNDFDSENKIMKNIMKEITIDKDETKK
jgi:hypothetical protein